MLLYKRSINGTRKGSAIRLLNVKKLLGRMVEKGYTQRKLAKAIDMSENTMSSRITLKTSFNIDEIERICNVLGIVDNSDKIEIFLFSSSHNRDENNLVK